MKLSRIIRHLHQRGFVTRKRWGGKTVLFFGMDNIGWLSQVGETNHPPCRVWTPNLEELEGNDWIKLPLFWKSSVNENKVIAKAFILAREYSER